MRICDELSRSVLFVVCLLKVYHNIENDTFEKIYKNDKICTDTYYDFAYEAIQTAAPIVMNDDNLYKKYGYCYDDGEVNIWAYSSKGVLMRYDDELIIHIKNDGNVFVEYIENGIHSCKTIDSEVFINCIRDSITTSAVTSGIMPVGSFYYSVSNDVQKICIEFMPRRCDIVYEKTEYKNFPLPRLVFGFVICGERIVNLNLGVAGDGLLTPKTQMYVYPFFNVSGFRLCCGANHLPNIKSLHQLTGVMHYIMSMPNNNDHYSRERTRLDLELRHLFETLKDKEPQFYYTDVLFNSGKTLQDFVNI